MLKKISFFCLVGLLVLFSAQSQAKISSVVVDAQSGNILYSSNAQEQRFPASLTKLMTLYITFNALEQGKLHLTDKLTVSRTAADRSPSKLGLKAGEKIDVKTCILAAIVKSANDCATVLGESLAPSERDFAVLMTETAHKLGMKNTTFKNASGLQHSAQKTTAEDMAVLALALYHHFPQYYGWFSLTSFEYNGKQIKGHNDVLKEFSGAEGLKTGYTLLAGFNIITTAFRDGHRLIGVTMGHKELKDRDKHISMLLDKTFEHISSNKTVDIQKLHAQIELPQGLKRKTKYASFVPNKPQTNSKEFLIQVGAFASQEKAKAQANLIRQKIAKNITSTGTNVEKLAASNKTMYRAQIIGLSQMDAQKACTYLKSKNQSCLVLKQTTFAQR